MPSDTGKALTSGFQDATVQAPRIGLETAAVPVFQPWVGPGYGEWRGDLRLLIVGESHYGDPQDERFDVTRQVVRELAMEGRFAFFTKIARLCSADPKRPLPQEDKIRFWQQVAFYNYVQSFLPKPRVRPSPLQWHDAARCFPQVLDMLRPDAVLVLGLQLGSRMRADGVLPERSAIVMHPSAPGFGYAEHASIMQQLYEDARKASRRP